VTFSTGSVAEWAKSARWRFETKPHWNSGRRGGVGDYRNDHFIHVDSAGRRDWHVPAS